jgi:hypothetical protein
MGLCLPMSFRGDLDSEARFSEQGAARAQVG